MILPKGGIGMMKYYSIHRPIGPGSFPKPDGNKVLEIVNYDSCQYIHQIGREAWGYIVYENRITDKEAANYELVWELTCSGCVNEKADRSMDCCWDCNRNPRRNRQDLYRVKQ